MPNLRDVFWISPFALLLVGCGSADAPADETGTVQAALNGTGDFTFGVEVVQNNDRGNASVISPLAQTLPLSSAPGMNTTVFSSWASVGVADPTGIRVVVTPASTSVSGYMIFADFRLVIQARDDPAGSDIGQEAWTPWASDLGGVSTSVTSAMGGSFAAYATNSRAHPAFYRVGYQIRSWPKSNRTLVDFNVGCEAVGKNPQDPDDFFDIEWGPKFGHYISNGGGASPTCTAYPLPSNLPYLQRGMEVILNVKYQDG